MRGLVPPPLHRPRTSCAFLTRVCKGDQPMLLYSVQNKFAQLDDSLFSCGQNSPVELSGA